ncbi:MAG: hypothetical protein WCP34_17450, partial [Pseudomonadota bacterium]
GGAVSNLVPFSYDPGPDVFFTNLTRFGTRAFTNDLYPRFNINLATNAAALVTVSNLLADARVPAADDTAWNILNYLDPGRLPVVAAGAPPAYRTGASIKDVPLINKVALMDSNSTWNYSVAVELWYPFVPNNSPANAKVWVGVYTNGAPNADLAPVLADYSYEVTLPSMQYGGSNEFFVARMPGAIAFQHYDGTDWVPDPIGTYNHQVWIWPRVYINNTCVDEALVSGETVQAWIQTGCYQFDDPRANHSLAHAIFTNAPTPALGTNNANCSIPSLPLMHTDAPMHSAGELRNIYAPDLPGGRIDFTTALGGACRDRFTVLASNAPVHGLFQANTPYTNIWQAILSDVTIGWSNQIYPTECFSKIGTTFDPTSQVTMASAAANALRDTSGRGWVRFEELFPILGASLLGNVMTTNRVDGMDAQAVCGDILAGIADRVSFRQNSFLIIVCGQRLSPMGRVLADQRAACIIVRDAYTGRWVVDHMVWLTD